MAKIATEEINAHIVVNIGFFIVSQAGDCDRIRICNGKMAIRVSLAKARVINWTDREAVGRA
ncbi:unnamed protein product [marine sediment metagenome]|uniref:Uncharacterized protein n=1 Tax=marine sediment metagenome TaxID=412755 RepID=X0XR99_9ZZZZ